MLKLMLSNYKAKHIVDLYFEILPFAQAFRRILMMIIGMMTTPVSSCTTEISVSKVRLIKTIARNSMSDGRLSDFTIDYDKIVDSFPVQHKNSRMLLK